MSANVRWFSDLGMSDLEQVGGKNASLGEMVSNLSDLGVQVPDGFATTSDAYHRFIGDTGLAERISGLLDGLDTDDVRRLAEVGKEIRAAVVEQEFPEDLEADIREAYDRLVEESGQEMSFAVRSCATAEDLPDASFAGQQETFLNVRGIDAILHAIREVYASLYNDRAIAYRVHHGFAHGDVGLSAGVQRMVRSDLGASGRDVHDGHRVGLPGRRLHHLGLRPRRGRGAGRGEPRRVLRLQAGAARGPARRAQARRGGQGDQDGLHRRRDRRPDHRVRRRRPRASGAGSASPTTRSRSWPGTRWSSRSTTAARWTSSGARTASTAGSTCCRPARRPSSRAARPSSGSRCRRRPPPGSRCWSRAARSGRRSARAPRGC